MEADIGHPLAALRADGGASGNRFLMQLQADILDRKVETADVEEVGALGAACMAFAALGHAMPLPAPSRSHAPGPGAEGAKALRALWEKALPSARRHT